LNNTPLHPTPVYEFLAALFLFGILWYYREKIIVPGKLFMLYLIIAGLSRFLVEMIRLNPIFIFNMTEAQFISVLMMIAGVWGLLRLKPKIASSGTEPSPIDSNASAKAKVNKDRNSRHKPKK
jgi:phosphatidylglycerol:prolipoprotein diacylglycerol transferase